MTRLGIRPAGLPLTGSLAAWGTEHLAGPSFATAAAWHIDRQTFDQALRRGAAAAGATVWRGRVSGWRRAFRRWELDVVQPAGGVRGQVDFVLDCTGRSASFARAQPGNRRLFHDHLIAILRSGPTSDDHRDDGRIVTETVPEGWWYTARSPAGRVVGFCTDVDLPAARWARKSAGWQTMLGRTVHISARLSAPSKIGSLAARVASAATSRLAYVAGDGWAAVGDAAAARDPISSHGVLAALTQGQRAALAVLDQFGGAPGALEGYAVSVVDEFERYLKVTAT